MRDPNRIPVLLAALGRVWMENPDWRLGQLVVNATSAIKEPHPTDPFYIEDDKLLEGLDRLKQK